MSHSRGELVLEWAGYTRIAMDYGAVGVIETGFSLKTLNGS